MKDTILVNSFQRTGSTFFRDALFDYAGYSRAQNESSESEQYHDIDMLEHPKDELPQIAILRMPMDSIVSNKILRSYRNSDIEYSTHRSAIDWISWHLVLLKNIDLVYPFLFEQIKNHTDQCLLDLANYFSIQKSTTPRTGEISDEYDRAARVGKNIFMTSLAHPDYQQVAKEYVELDKDVLDFINILYDKVKKAILARQQALKWEIPEH